MEYIIKTQYSALDLPKPYGKLSFEDQFVGRANTKIVVQIQKCCPPH